MQANELRIGNFVQHNAEWNYAKHNGVFIWSDRDWYALGESTLLLDNFKPIPLTEEWLEKLCFKRYDIMAKQLYVTNGNITLTSTSDGIISMEIEGQLLPLNHIKYVHQLQNLYFALTGEELTIS